MYNPLKITLIVDGKTYNCHGMMIEDQETGSARPASEQETVALIMGHYDKPRPFAYSLKEGGTLILGPMASARAQITVKPNEPGQVKMPKVPNTIGDN